MFHEIDRLENAGWVYFSLALVGIPVMVGIGRKAGQFIRWMFSRSK
jgi:hypothetical protein